LQVKSPRVTGDVTLCGWTTRRTDEQSGRRLDFLLGSWAPLLPIRLVVELNPSMMVQHSPSVRCPGKVVMDAPPPPPSPLVCLLWQTQVVVDFKGIKP